MRADNVENFADLLRGRARDQPDRLGYVFLADGEADEQPLTYAEADRRAAAVAAGLRAAGALPGSRAILILPPGLDYLTAFFGCLYAGVVAVPVYPPDPFQLERTLPRLLAIVEDAAPAVALTITPVLGLLDDITRIAPGLGALEWLAVDGLPDAAAGAGDPEPTPSDGTALLQYTSGSTSSPRGVMLSHGNLLHNSGVIQRLFRATPETRGLIWLPPYHDMGLIGGLLQPLYGGLPVTLMSPLHFLEDPMRWLRAISRHGSTASGGPNFAYDLCVRKATPEQIADLDLSTWQVAFNGAEPIRPQTLRRFADAFAPAGFRPDTFLPCYGLAEATLIVTGVGGRPADPARDGVTPAEIRVDRAALERHLVAAPTDGPVAALTGCGAGVEEQRVEIVDPDTATLCAAGRVGEIWVAGPSVAKGYWGRPEESADAFGARLADGSGPFLRTGDLGFRQDGHLVVTGRIKDLMIVRGQNHYPQDIELAAERADAVLRPGCTAAFLAAPDEGDDDLVLVHEVRRDAGEIDADSVAARVRQAVAAEHGLQVRTVVLIRAGGMPKTSSGKVQRRLCRTRFLSGELPVLGRSRVTPGSGRSTADAGPEQVFAAPPEQRRAAVERYLRGRVADLVGVGSGGLGPDDPLLAAGLDSLAVVQLKHRLESDLGFELALPVVLGGATFGAVAESIAGELGEEPADAAVTATATATTITASSPAIDAPSNVEHVVPLSEAQRRMWFLQQVEPGNTAYTIAAAVRSADPVDGGALHRALDAVVKRHPALRTTFDVRDGEPVQIVRPDAEASYEEHDAAGFDDKTLAPWVARAVRQPFDLRTGPLLRVRVFHTGSGDVLLLTAHHIVADFQSLIVLARELGAYYTAFAAGRSLTLPPPRAAHADFVSWQTATLADPVIAERLASYWDGVVGDGVPRLAPLPLLGKQSAHGGSHAFALPPALAARLRERAAAEKSTLFVLLLATFQALLHGVTGQNDLAVGANTAARSRPEFDDVVGLCTNPVLIRSTTAPDESFRGLLARARAGVIGALEHQDYPMTMVAARHQVRRATLADALFTLNRSLGDGDDLAAVAFIGPPGVQRSLGALRVERFPLPAAPAGVPVEMALADIGGVPQGLLRYRGDALDAATAEQFVQRYVAMLELVAVDPAVPVAELSLKAQAAVEGVGAAAE